jgi:hypothetical protein
MFLNAHFQTTDKHNDWKHSLSKELTQAKYSHLFAGVDRPWGLQEVQPPLGFSTGTQRWQGCQPCAPATFTSQEDPWYSFLQEAESNSGTQSIQKG